jgi:hypothetical protein
MKNNWKYGMILGTFAALLSCSGEGDSGLKDAVVLIIRHAEKPASGQDLSAEGQARAHAYIRYFGDYQIDGQRLKLDRLFAAKDSKKSDRPCLTLEPLSQATKLPLDCSFKHREPEKLAAELKSKPQGKNILICWRHEEIPSLLSGLGADPAVLLPAGKWPDAIFNWVIELRYDGAGRLVPGECRRVTEHLMPQDAGP